MFLIKMMQLNKYEGSFILALEALGIPIVQCLYERSTSAMWADATQHKIIKKHLWL
jgi:hypothetical protein